MEGMEQIESELSKTGHTNDNLPTARVVGRDAAGAEEPHPSLFDRWSS